MALEFASLSDQPFSRIHDAFLEAFADYHLDMSYLTQERLENRMIKNGVDYEASVGAFAAGRLVGFTLIGLDHVDGVASAFDAATGIVPEHRGSGVAGRMFDYARQDLVRRGVGRFLLEVLTVNEAAIKAYRKAGFRIQREMSCYRIDPAKVRLPPQEALAWLEVRPIAREEVSLFVGFADWRPSWENSFSALARIPDEVFLFGAYVDRQPAGLGAYYPGLQWVPSLIVAPTHRRRGIATRLLGHVLTGPAGGVSEVKVVNVDGSDDATAALLGRLGFECYVKQYEMVLDLVP